MSILSAFAWAVGRLLPVNPKKVVISCFYGRGCADSPKAIGAALLRQNKDLQVICLTDKNRADNIPVGITPKSYGSLSRIYQLSTAAVWVDNCRKGAGYKKKGQFYLQTWHGFALKRIEKDASDALGQDYTSYAKRDSAQCDLFVSGSRHMTEIYKKSFWYDGPVLETGTPRNDILFSDTAALRRKVCKKLSIPEGWKIALYAPTFRADHSTDAYRLDWEKLQKACSDRFGGQWTVLIRLHPNVDTMAAGLFAYDGCNLKNASMYDDIQELLCATDLLITDYSSVMFDFALTGRPCFQFATDIEAYKKDRSFYFPLEELPFPRATDNASLTENILHFDWAAYTASWETFCKKFGIMEDGKAAQRCADIILDKMGLRPANKKENL